MSDLNKEQVKKQQRNIKRLKKRSTFWIQRFDGKKPLVRLEKNIEDYIKDGLIIIGTTTGMLFALKAANVKPPKASIDAMNVMKLIGGICGGVLVKVCTVYKKWINE